MPKSKSKKGRFVAIALFLTVIVVGALVANQTQLFQGNFSIPTASADIEITQPSSQVPDKLVVAGSTQRFIGTFKVEATDEDFTVDTIKLEISDLGSVDSFSQVTIKYPNNFSTPTTLSGSQTRTVAGNSVTFSGLNFTVQRNNENVWMEVYVDVTPHSDNGGSADTGDILQMQINQTADSFIASSATQTLTGADPGVVAANLKTNKPYVFKGIPEVSVPYSSGPIVYGADSEVFKFNITAVGGDISLLALRMDVSTSGILTGNPGLRNREYGGWKMYEVSGGSIDFSTMKGEGALVDDKALLNVRQNISDWAAGSPAFEIIPDGTTKTYVVLASILDDGIDNNNVISVRISSNNNPQFSKNVRSTYGDWISGRLRASALTWSDRPAHPDFGVGAGKQFWHNGYKVDGLPSSYISYI